MKIKKTLNLALAVALALSVVFSAPAQVVCAANDRSPFTDVKTSDWFFDYVLEAYDDGVMTPVLTTIPPLVSVSSARSPR